MITQLTLDEIMQKLIIFKNKIANGTASIGWMGVTISWEYRPKYCGGYFKRNKTWGILKFHDDLLDKDVAESEVINILAKPLAERKTTADLTKIKYCAMCGNIGIGEDELMAWGQLCYVKEIVTYKSGWKSPRREFKDICPKCCAKIVKKSLNEKYL